MSRYTHLPSDLVTLHKVGSEIQRVRRKLCEIFASAERMGIDLDNNATVNGQVKDELPPDYSLMDQKAEDEMVMVGFHDEYKEIADKLVRGGQILSAVSITAMGGAGKTTLARKVYTSSVVRQHFKTFAWVTVSQNFKCVDLLKQVMYQIMGEEVRSPDQTQEYELGKSDQMKEYELGKKISEYLSQKKYLVALDDVWEEDTWEQLVRAFPDGNNGSRVLLTTRKEKVATQLEMPTHVHVLKGLDEERSWELFSAKALPSYRRTMLADEAEFEKLGRMIAKRCDGLPLALSVLGGYLSHNLSIQTWCDVISCWPITKKTQIMQSILARSYYDIADHYLRSCFLYLPTFPEDRKIDVSVLITLWVAEGLIPHARKHEPEETARNYVAELAQRSLVQVTARSTAHGWIEQIRVHDVLRDWCIEEARKDGFLDVVEKTSGQGHAPSTNIMTSYRSCYQDFSGEKLHAAPTLQALIGFHLLGPIFLPTLRFLRVLYIEDATLENFSSAIEVCIFLRCLRLIDCKGLTIPPSIGQMLYLQTVDLTKTRILTRPAVPNSMWGIPSLRHVYLSNRFYPPRGVKQTELQTPWLKEVSVSGSELSNRSTRDMMRFLGQMTELRTLSLHVVQSMPAEVMNVIATMPHLLDLYLTMVSEIDRLPESRHFPRGLRSFQLYAAAIKQDPMAVLENLPCLVVLKLEGYKGRTMSCSARGFPRLQVLELQCFPDTEQWKIEVGAMPKLSRLILKGFLKLSMLPEGLLNLMSLNYLEMSNIPLISVGDDSTAKELVQKGCELHSIRYSHV